MAGKSPNKIAYFRETLENAAEAAKLPLASRAPFVQAATEIFSKMDDHVPVPSSFYDLPAAAAKIAETYKIATDAVLQNPETFVKQFFSIHLPPQKLHRTPKNAERDKRAKRLREVMLALETEEGREGLHKKAKDKKGVAVIMPRESMITLKNIEASARAELEATGRRPTALSTIIEHGPLANGIRTWMSVNNAFNSQSGALRDCGFLSLSDFQDAKGIFSRTALEQAKARGVTFSAASPTPAQRILRDAIRVIFRDAAVPFGSHNALTVVSENRTVSDLNKAFRQSTVGGWEDLMPGPAPKHFTGFMLGTGVAVKDNGQIVPAPKERLEAIAAMLKLP